MQDLTSEITMVETDLELVAGMRSLAVLVADASVRLGLLHDLDRDVVYLKRAHDNLVAIKARVDNLQCQTPSSAYHSR